MLENEYLKGVYELLQARDPNEREFLQSVYEVFSSLRHVVGARPDIVKSGVIERMTEPERTVVFRVSWVDDGGNVRVNRGYRVQFNSAIGPYKGGIRFHPSVNLSVMKFLGFEQTFKNALTGLPLGGGKGGSDFDPKGKSDGEIMRFCQSFMTELAKHIGQFTDIPAGDTGVGPREIGYMYGQYKRLKNEFTGVLTGKGLTYGGSLVRREATGYGLLYFTETMLNRMKNETVEGKNLVISGSGAVAVYACEKARDLGARVLAMSDSGGFVYDPDGIQPDVVKRVKESRGRISEYVKTVKTAVYTPGCKGLWNVKCDIALPCATQNELDGDAARALVKNGVFAVAEGANMPSTPEATEIFRAAGVLFAPGKAANAGGVATSGLEMAQNSQRCFWKAREVEAKMKAIMEDIFENIYAVSEAQATKGDLVAGANIAGFLKVAEAMTAQGVSY